MHWGLLIGILAILLALFGVLGSILPALPGPPLAWAGLLLLFFLGSGTAGGEEMSLLFLLLWLAITLVVSVLDYTVPARLTRKTGGTKYGSAGSMIGMLLGILFFPPWGMLTGAMIGAFVAELLLAQSGTGASLKAAWGSFLGFLAGTGLKLLASLLMLYYCVVYAF